MRVDVLSWACGIRYGYGKGHRELKPFFGYVGKVES